MIEYKTGDATSAEAGIIAHIVNDAGVWGAGFVLALGRKYPAAETRYRDWVAGRTPQLFGLGQVQWVRAIDRSPPLFVVNMCAQGMVPDHTGRRVDYLALSLCLKEVGNQAHDQGYRVHMPRIGCGIGGGKWPMVEALIRDCMPHVHVTVYDLP